jgi:predicted nucleic acid-binding protein
MAALRALLDTDVLWPSYLRDTLLRLGAPELGLFEPLWSKPIIDDLGRTLLEDRRIDAAGWERLAHALAGVPDALQEVPQDLIDRMTNDPGDRHVLAAAVAAGADFLITRNLRDFAREDCDPWGIEVLTPDAFLMALYRQSPEDVLDTLALQVAGYRKAPQTFVALLEQLRASGAEEFAFTVAGENDPDDLEQRVREFRDGLFELD